MRTADEGLRTLEQLLRALRRLPSQPLLFGVSFVARGMTRKKTHLAGRAQSLPVNVQEAVSSVEPSSRAFTGNSLCFPVLLLLLFLSSASAFLTSALRVTQQHRLFHPNTRHRNHEQHRTEAR